MLINVYIYTQEDGVGGGVWWAVLIFDTGNLMK